MINIPDPVNFIISRLNKAGYEAFAVGGCVRDALIGRVPNDWDITTSALPAQIKSVFRRTIDTGIQHGTVTVVLREGNFEVTTYRIDGIYEDGRHPKAVSFTSDLREDLKRRDFTVNAMAYHPAVGLVDAFGGKEDLDAGIIRAVGVPEERFEEDALRIMRAVRFAAQLGFIIEEKTLAAVSAFAPRLSMISSERIQAELVKLITSPHPGLFSTLIETGIAGMIMPVFSRKDTGFNEVFPPDVLSALLRVEPDHILRLAVLFSRCDHNEVEAWLRECKFDNATITGVGRLVQNIGFPYPEDMYGVRLAACTLGTGPLSMLFNVMSATGAAEKAALLREKFECILADGDCVSLKMLAVTGADLIAAGIKPGPSMGEILNKMLDIVLRDPAMNEKEKLMRLI